MPSNSMLPGCCGVQVIHDIDLELEEYDPRWSGSRKAWKEGMDFDKENYDMEIDDILAASSTGFLVASFINSEAQYEGYKRLCKKLTLVTQTKPRRSRSSGNEIFVAVFAPKKGRRS